MLPLALVLALLVGAAPDNADAPLAEVNGKKISERDLEAYLLLRGQKGRITPPQREKLTQELVDRELVRQFLRRRKTEADADLLAVAMRTFKSRQSAAAADSDEQGQLSDDARIRAELALPLAWRQHVQRVTTEKQIRNYFTEHRRQLDGTSLRVSQIFMKYANGETQTRSESTEERMTQLRDKVAAGELSFADAAQKYSESPSAAKGGDVGWITREGDLPAVVAEAAYQLELDEVSKVIRSPFGLHLLKVTEVRDGDLSLEDVRQTVLNELSQKLWEETVAAERMSAKIQLAK